MRSIGLAPLSSLSVAPDTLVRLAADIGFDFVGLRVHAVTPDEPNYDLSPGSPLLERTLSTLSETGITVIDAEFLRIDADTGPDTWMPALEAASAVGATRFTVAAGDDDIPRLTDTLCRMVQDAAPFGVIPALEPISYRSVHSLPVAASIGRTTGARVLADTLHLSRFPTSEEEIVDAAPLIDMVQLTDCPATRPSDLAGLVEESRALRYAPGDGDQNLARFLHPLPADLPVSLEVPNDGDVARRGPEAWFRHLYNSTVELLDSKGL